MYSILWLDITLLDNNSTTYSSTFIITLNLLYQEIINMILHHEEISLHG